MAKLTERARGEQQKSGLQRWWEKQVMDDPRPIEEQRLDEMSPDRSPIWFGAIVLICIAIYVGLIIGFL